MFQRSVSFPLMATCCALAAASIIGCGDAPYADEARATPAGDAARARPAAVVTPLIADDGTLMPSAPQAVPADTGAHTRQGRYATSAQAAQLEDSFGQAALPVEVGCCSAEAVEVAVGIVWGMQAAHALPNDTPVLVRGRDLRLAAAAVNRLAEGGLTRVWLVAP